MTFYCRQSQRQYFHSQSNYAEHTIHKRFLVTDYQFYIHTLFLKRKYIFKNRSNRVISSFPGIYQYDEHNQNTIHHDKSKQIVNITIKKIDPIPSVHCNYCKYTKLLSKFVYRYFNSNSNLKNADYCCR